MRRTTRSAMLNPSMMTASEAQVATNTPAICANLTISGSITCPPAGGIALSVRYHSLTQAAEPEFQSQPPLTRPAGWRTRARPLHISRPPGSPLTPSAEASRERRADRTARDSRLRSDRLGRNIALRVLLPHPRHRDGRSGGRARDGRAREAETLHDRSHRGGGDDAYRAPDDVVGVERNLGGVLFVDAGPDRSEEHTSELQS